MKKSLLIAAVCFIALKSLFACDARSEVKPKLNLANSCDRIISAAQEGKLLASLVGQWGVPTGFDLKILKTGRVEFSNYQYDEVVDYPPGEITEASDAVFFKGMFQNDPWTKTSGKVAKLRCQIFSFNRQGQIMISFDLAEPSGFYSMSRYLEAVEPDRCLEFDYEQRQPVECVSGSN